jgi:hypothetical protein
VSEAFDSASDRGFCEVCDGRLHAFNRSTRAPQRICEFCEEERFPDMLSELIEPLIGEARVGENDDRMTTPFGVTGSPPSMTTSVCGWDCARALVNSLSLHSG